MQMSFQHYSAIERYRDNFLANEHHGWAAHTVTVKGHEFPGPKEDCDNEYNYTFRCRNISNVLQQICGDESLKDAFSLQMKVRTMNIDSQSVRIFQQVTECDAAITAYRHVRYLKNDGEHENTVLLLQLYSDKTIVNVKNVACHPIRLAVLNLPLHEKEKRIEIVGYFPIVPTGTNRVHKLLVLTRCFIHLLEPLKVADSTGEVWLAPDGQKYRFFTRILSYIADDPEIRDILCINAHNSEYPCERCEVAAGDLATHHECFEARDAVEIKRKAEEMLQKVASGEVTIGKAVKECQKFSFVPVVSGLHTLLNSCDPEKPCNYNHIFGFDTLHIQDLGLVINLVDAIVDWIKKAPWPERGFKYVFNHMNKMLNAIRHSTSITLPSSPYFPDHGAMQGKEHRGVLQVLPHIFSDVLRMLNPKGGQPSHELQPFIDQGRDILIAVCLNAFCYAACHRKNTKPYFTAKELDPEAGEGSIQRAINETNDATIAALGPHLRSHGMTTSTTSLIPSFSLGFPIIIRRNDLRRSIQTISERIGSLQEGGMTWRKV